MKTNVSSLGQGPGLEWKRNTSSFPPGSLAELEEWTGGKTEPPWHGEVDFQQWNTIGWGLTDDGILCIKPWKGDTGETGAVTNYNGTPWYSQRPMINKVESTGTIVLNEDSAYLFYLCPNLTDITTLEDWDVSNVTDTSGMFAGCSSLRDLDTLTGWEVSNVTNTSGMFQNCSSLRDLRGLEDWNVSKVTNMNSMFQNCSSLRDLRGLEDWNVSKVTSMSAMFSGCSTLTDLRTLTEWNVPEVTNMSGMFRNCSRLTDLTGIYGWNASKVTNMSNMFNGCSSLNDLIGLAGWDVSNVTNMSGMFYGCSGIQRIGIPSIANGGQNLVENAEAAKLTTVLPSIISEDGSMGPLAWDELNTEMTTNPATFQEGTVWVKAEEEAQ